MYLNLTLNENKFDLILETESLPSKLSPDAADVGDELVGHAMFHCSNCTGEACASTTHG